MSAFTSAMCHDQAWLALPCPHALKALKSFSDGGRVISAAQEAACTALTV